MLQFGEPDISALWPLAEGLLFFMNYFSEKEGFLDILSNNKIV